MPDQIVCRIRAMLFEAYSTYRMGSPGQIAVLVPDSPYSDTPISQAVIEAALQELPDVYAFSRFHETDGVPFCGWQIVFRNQTDA